MKKIKKAIAAGTIGFSLVSGTAYWKSVQPSVEKIEKSIESKSYETAQKQIDKLIKKDNDNFYYKIMKAELFEKEGKTSEAKKVYEEILGKKESNINTARFNAITKIAREKLKGSEELKSSKIVK